MAGPAISLPGSVGGTTSPGGAPKSIGLGALGGQSFGANDWDDPIRMSIIVEGAKHAGKSVSLADTPRPYGGRTVYLSFDDATRPSLIGRWGKKWLAENQVECIDLYGPKIEKGTGVILSPGFDPNKPDTARSVIARTFKELEKLEAEKDVDNIILDHFQELHENIAQVYAKLVNGKDPLGRLEFQEWNDRTMPCKLIEAKARSIARNIVYITGYGAEEENVMETVQVAGGRTKTVITKKVVDQSWASKYQRPYLVNLVFEREIEKAGEPGREDSIRYYIRVTGSKDKEEFRPGLRVEVTGSGISKFFEETSNSKKAAEALDAVSEPAPAGAPEPVSAAPRPVAAVVPSVSSPKKEAAPKRESSIKVG